MYGWLAEMSMRNNKKKILYYKQLANVMKIDDGYPDDEQWFIGSFLREHFCYYSLLII
jgi:hypothetical protein